MNYRSESRLAPCLRILCLHDANSNASQLSDKLEELGERLYEKHAIDLVYVNSPLLKADPNNEHPFRPPTMDDLDEEEDDDNNNNNNNNNDDEERKAHKKKMRLDPRGRVWWEDSGKEDGKQFLALDASLLLMKQVWNSMPFWGVLGVGDGAAVASFLPLLSVDPMPAFGIFVHGTTILEEEELLIDAWPSLHVVGSNPGASEKLYRQFGGQVHQGGINFTKSTLNAIGKFLIEQKNSMRHSGEGMIQVLQNQLYLAEQEAADAVARRIAENPPALLQAVITPQNVGGWSGQQKKRPEGGGAPCPSEFLLNREKRRTGDANGPSRVHPSEQPKQQQDQEQSKGEDTTTSSTTEEEDGKTKQEKESSAVKE